MAVKVLITGFKPFGIIGGIILNRNDSEIIAKKLSEQFKTDLLILPVNNNCFEMLKSKIKKEKYNLIFMMGCGTTEIQIETKTSKNKVSKFAENIKNKMGFNKEGIVNYYCGRTYDLALNLNKNTIFVHIPYFCDYDKIKKIFKECLLCWMKY